MKDLAKLADEYIIDAESDIKVVIGLHIHDGSKSKRATISVWRPQIAPDPLYGSYTYLKARKTQDAEARPALSRLEGTN